MSVSTRVLVELVSSISAVCITSAYSWCRRSSRYWILGWFTAAKTSGALWRASLMTCSC